MACSTSKALWTRYDDPQPLLDEIAELPAESATERIQQIYAEPIKPELIVERLHEIRDAGVTVAGALSPQRTQDYYSTVLEAGVDLFVIRGTVVSAEHVSQDHEPLNLKKFIYDLDVPVIVAAPPTTPRPALDAYRRGRRARRLRRRRSIREPQHHRCSRSDGHRHRRRGRSPPRLHGRVPAGVTSK